MGQPRGALAHLDTIVREHVAPAVRAAGGKGGARGPWRFGDATDGWVVLAVQRNRWNTAAEAGLWINEAVWPPGTFEWLRGQAHESQRGSLRPFAAGDAPLNSRPAEVLGPDVDPNAHSVELREDATPEEVAAAGQRLAAYATAALSWSRAMRDPERFAERALETGELTYAVVSLRAACPRSPLLAPALDARTAAFQRDPRPVELGPTLRSWRAEAGLVDVELPAFWHTLMRRGPYRQYSSPRAMLDAGIGSGAEIHFADGTYRLPVRSDVPGEDTVRRWAEDRRANPVGEGVVEDPPEWLVWETWLDAVDDTHDSGPAARRQRRLRVPKMLRAISRPITAAADRAT